MRDAKAQFGEVVNSAMREVPQHVTKRGKPAVVVLSEQEFDALRRSAGRGASNWSASPANFVDLLLAMPNSSGTKTQTSARMRFGKAVSGPVRKGANGRPQVVRKNGLPVIQARPGLRKITSEDVRRSLEGRP